MASERGLPSIPRGLGRELTAYLQAEQSLLMRLSGLARGSEKSRAVRVSEGSVGTGTTAASVGQGSITTRHLADNTVTSSKLADGAVTAKKLGQSSVTEKAIQAGAVTEDALAAGAITRSKLSTGVLPVFFSGEAEDGATVILPGVWSVPPVVVLMSFSIPQADEPTRIGVTDLHESSDMKGKWEFMASGSFTWVAIGFTQ